MDRVEWRACKSCVLGLSAQDSVALAERRLTPARKMLSASEMGTFSEPKPCDSAVVRVLAVLAF